MTSSGFPLDGVFGELWGSTACWLELVGKLLPNAGSAAVATEGKGLSLTTFFVLSLAFFVFTIVAKHKVAEIRRNLGFYTRT